MVDMQNKYNHDRCLFNGTLLWTRDNLRDAQEHASDLEARVRFLEGELQQARSFLSPGVRNSMLRLFEERDNARAEVGALSKALAASRADVARQVESERDLEMNVYRLHKRMGEVNDEVNHLRHLDSMKRVDLDASQFALTNLHADYKKLSAEYDFLDEALDAIVNEYEEASANVEALEGQLHAANNELKKTQSALVQQEGQTNHFKGLSASREEAAEIASKEAERLSVLLSQAHQRTAVITYKARCQLAEETNKVLDKIELGLKVEHGLFKNYPRRPLPVPLPSSSGPSSGGSVPSSRRDNPVDGSVSSK